MRFIIAFACSHALPFYASPQQLFLLYDCRAIADFRAVSRPEDIVVESMALPKPFKIDVPQSSLDDLKQRLQQTRLPDHIPGVGWDMGTDLAYLQVYFMLCIRRLTAAPRVHMLLSFYMLQTACYMYVQLQQTYCSSNSL